jgi:hypothetical protein
MKIISCSIDLSKIDKSQIKTTDKNGNPFANGAKYYNFQVFLNSEPDQYGNHAAIAENQTQEQRGDGEKKKYIGNGKIVFINSNDGTSTKKTETQETPPPATQTFETDLPF